MGGPYSWDNPLGDGKSERQRSDFSYADDGNLQSKGEDYSYYKNGKKVTVTKNVIRDRG
jgi:hypothetical protein